MGEAGGNVDLIVSSAESSTLVHFPKCGEPADVYSDVQGFTFNYTAQFGLRLTQLIVKAAERSHAWSRNGCPERKNR